MAAQGEGDWAITSVLHDATAVVTPISSQCLDFSQLPSRDGEICSS